MDFVVYPYQGVGPIRFGMIRKEVRELIDDEFKVLVFNFNEPETWDSFNVGIQVCYSYDPPHICEAILLESIQKARFLNRQLLGEESIGDLRDWLKILDENLVVDSDNVTTYKFGFALSRQVEDFDLFQLPPEAVTCFREGYYGELRTT